MSDYTNDIRFWKRLKSFVSNVQCSDCCGEEEKEMILNVCELKLFDIGGVVKVEPLFCMNCGKRKRMKGDGTLELLCECGETPVICPDCKIELTLFLDGRLFCEDCLKIYKG